MSGLQVTKTKGEGFTSMVFFENDKQTNIFYNITDEFYSKTVRLSYFSSGATYHALDTKHNADVLIAFNENGEELERIYESVYKVEGRPQEDIASFLGVEPQIKVKTLQEQMLSFINEKQKELGFKTSTTPARVF